MNRATYIGKTKAFENGWWLTHLFYEYKGHEYMVCDYGWQGYSEPLWVQHKNEQARIDKIIAQETKPQKEFKYEDTAEAGFELFWKYVEEEG